MNNELNPPEKSGLVSDLEFMSPGLGLLIQAVLSEMYFLIYCIVFYIAGQNE
jgi:hypothetical protein